VEVTPPVPWDAERACGPATAALFFGGSEGDTEAAKAICAGCPCREACLSYALANRELDHGVWGGLDPAERRKLARRRGAQRCGTLSGYVRHQELGEPSCERCREAKRIDTAERRRARRAA
jgi:WhiB family redox-sensing transcriptional regulator